VKRDGQVSSGWVSAGRLSGMTWILRFFVGIVLFGLRVNLSVQVYGKFLQIVRVIPGS